MDGWIMAQIYKESPISVLLTDSRTFFARKGDPCIIKYMISLQQTTRRNTWLLKRFGWVKRFGLSDGCAGRDEILPAAVQTTL
jgi:hypothetical protein